MVVPVEPISLTIGAVALASLFSTCIECFDYFKAGQALEEDFELLLVKLDVEKTRLLIWGNAVGVLKAEGEGRVLELNDADRAELIERCLEKIKYLLSNTDTLQSIYGLQPSANAENGSRAHSFLSINSMSVFRTSYRRFCVRFAGNQSRATLARRTRWAIHDKTKFEGLIHHLKDLIDGLNQVVLVDRETQDQIMHDDIVSILDISRLRLIQSACEGSYTTLSRAASATIAASEFGTIDRRNVEEWLGDAVGLGQEDDDDGDVSGGNKEHRASSHLGEISIQAPIFTFIPGLPDSENGGVYFVLAGKCRGLFSNSPCQLDQLGKDCAENNNSFLSPRVPEYWKIGKRICDTLNPARFTGVDLDELMKMPMYELTGQQNAALPVAVCYIYCAPCACLLATAFSICKEAGNNATTYFKFLVRPDDRLISTCCSRKDRSVGLTSIIERIKEIETSLFLFNHLDLIDKVWVEQRLYEIEEGIEHPQPIDNIGEMGGKIFTSHHTDTKTASIIMLGEVEYLLPIIRSPPFPSLPRIPKETEIFQFKTAFINGAYNWTRKFLGTYTPKAGYVTPMVSLGRSESSEEIQSPLAATSAAPGAFPLASSGIRAQSSGQASSTLALPRQPSPPPSPASKRHRSSPSQSIIMEEEKA